MIEELTGIASFIIPLIIGAIAGTILEHWLKTYSTIVKLWHFLVNAESSLKMVFVFSGNTKIAEIKDIFYKTEKEDTWHVLKEERNKVIYSNDEATFEFVVNPDGKVSIETSKITKPIREIGGCFDSQCQTIQKFADTAEIKLESAWFEVHLPYYKEFAKFCIPPRYLELKDYQLSLHDKCTGSNVKVVLGTISASNKALSDLKTIFYHVIAIY